MAKVIIMEKKEEVKPKVEDTSTELSLVERMEKSVREAKAENDRHEELTKRDEAAKVRDTLGGTADAGQQPPEKPEVSNVDYAKEVLAGKHNEPATKKE